MGDGGDDARPTDAARRHWSARLDSLAQAHPMSNGSNVELVTDESLRPIDPAPTVLRVEYGPILASPTETARITEGASGQLIAAQVTRTETLRVHESLFVRDPNAAVVTPRSTTLET